MYLTLNELLFSTLDCVLFESLNIEISSFSYTSISFFKTIYFSLNQAIIMIIIEIYQSDSCYSQVLQNLPALSG